MERPGFEPRLVARRTSPNFAALGVPFSFPLYVVSVGCSNKQTANSHEPIACITVHSTARYVVNCCPVGTIGGAGWSSVFFCGRFWGWYPSEGSAKCNPRVFVEGVREHCLLFFNDPMPCYANPTKPNTNMPGRCFSCVAGWHVDERYCNGGRYPVPFVAFSRHIMCSFWHFVRIPCNVDIIGSLWVIAGLTTFMSPLFTPNSTIDTIRTNIHRISTRWPPA